MVKKWAVGFKNIWNPACLTTIFAAACMISILTGCLKEKQEKWAPHAASGACEIYDKMQLLEPVEINYGNKIKLLGITIKKVSQNEMELSYFWQVLDDLGAYKQVFVHFTNPVDNEILFQDDHLFCRKFFVERAKGRFLKESSIVRIPQPALGNAVNLMVGVYAPELKSGPRLSVESLKGVPVSGNAAIFSGVKL